MSRITYELGYKGSGEYDTDNTYNMPANGFFKALNKLGQLEDIEEELGIDLVTLFKALLEDGIFFNDGHGKIIHVKAKDLWLRTDTKTYNIDFCRPLYTSNLSVDCNLKDYGKTWALTKGELE